jgi:predicted metal-dependent phosphoesterase TrpH
MIDLQIHSTYSDGTLSPRQLVVEAKKLNLLAIALTDHDTVEGIPEFLKAGLEFKLITIPGVEISARADLPPGGHLHILGLFIDHHNKELRANLAFLQSHRNQRAIKIVERLKDLGIEISVAELQQEAGEGSIGRPHISKILFRKKVVPSLQAAFEKYIGKGKPAFVEKVKFSEHKSIQLVKKAGGLAILAHPHLMNYQTFSEMQRKIISLKELDLDGIEAYYSGLPAGYLSKIIDLAKKLNLVISGGSDFHGKNKEGILMGSGTGNLQIPDSVYYHLVERWEKLKLGKL